MQQTIKAFTLILLIFSSLANALSPKIVTPSTNGRLEDYPKATSTWGDVLNPTQTVPDEGFQAYYINTNRPKTVIASEKTKNVAIDYAFNGFHNIKADDFGGYWVGKINIPEDGLYRLSARQSHSQTRILIDKHIVFSSDDKDSSVVRLQKGSYTLEVEYINNWHTMHFVASIAPVVKEIDKNNLKQAIEKLNLPKETVVYTVGIYGSDSVTNNVFVQVLETAKPYIIILNSRRGVTWDILDNQPALIIYNNASKGSVVKAEADVPVLAWKGEISYRIANRGDIQCRCSDEEGGKIIGCRQPYPLEPAMDYIQQVTGFPLKGVSGEDSTQAVLVPDFVIDENLLQDNNKRRQQFEKIKKEGCKKAPVKKQTIEGLIAS